MEETNNLSDEKREAKTHNWKKSVSLPTAPLIMTALNEREKTFSASRKK